MKPRCLVLDLDGTLVDSERLNCRDYIEFIDEITDDEETLTTRYRGMRFANIVGDIAARYGASLEDDFEPRYRRHMERLYEAELVANPGVRSLLSSLDIPRCVASSAPLKKTERALEITELDEYFGANIFSAYEVGAWKPEPDLFLHAAATMNVAPEECVVVEDSEPSVKAGIAAGMQVVHYQPDRRKAIMPGCIGAAHFDEIAIFICNGEDAI